MEARGIEEMEAGSFVIRRKLVTPSQLGGKALKAALPEIYSQYCKVSASRRFTVAQEGKGWRLNIIGWRGYAVNAAFISDKLSRKNT